MSKRGYQAIAGLDCIQLAGISAHGQHGVYPTEREQGQTFVADVDMYCDLGGAASSDEVADTTDYSQVAAAVREVLAGPALHLIEAVADRVATRVLRFDGVQAVRVRIHKPQAPMDTQVGDVAVTLWRGLGFDSDDEQQAAAAPQAGSGSGAVQDGAPPAAAASARQQVGDPQAGDTEHSRQDAHQERDEDEGGAGVRADFPGLDHAPRAPRSAVLALGANLGKRTQTLIDVVAELDMTPGIGVTEVSPLVQTEAVLRPGQEPQPDYLNAVVIVRTSLSPRALLRALQAIEDRHGRTRVERWGARPLDIDIITYQDVYSLDPQLTLPHPRAAQRAFVLVPWSRIDPHAQLNGHPITQLIAQAPDRGGIRAVRSGWLTAGGDEGAAPDPLPLPRWRALAADKPRILDDPAAVVRSDQPVDPRLRMDRTAGAAAALGLAGVSDRAQGGPSHLPRFGAAHMRPPTLWERIKAFFQGRKAQPQPVNVVDTEACAAGTQLPALPAAAAPLRQVDVDAPDTAATTAAVSPAAGPHPAGAAAAGSVARAAAERASFVPVPPPVEAAAPVPAADAQPSETAAASTAADTAPGAADTAAFSRQPQSGSAGRQDHDEPGPAAPQASPADSPDTPLPAGLARVFASADLTVPGANGATPAGGEETAAGDTSPGPDHGQAQPHGGAARQPADDPAPASQFSAEPSRPAAAGVQHEAVGEAEGGAVDLPRPPRHGKHSADTDGDAQLPPPPPVPSPMDPPATQEFTAQDIAEAGQAAVATPVKRTSIIRPTTTGVIPAVRDNPHVDGPRATHEAPAAPAPPAPHPQEDGE